MLPSPAGGLPLSTSASSNNPTQVPSTAPSASAAAAAAAAASAAASAASSAPAGAKRPAATDLQRGPGTTPSKRHATTSHRASISGFPISTSSSPSTLTVAPGFAPLGTGTGASSSSSSSTAARHRHARSHSHAAPIMSVSTTTTPMIPLPQPTSAVATHQYPPPSPHRPPLPPPHPPSVPQHFPQTFVTEEQLSGRSPDQLIATILQIQSQHQQYAAHLSAQYDNIVQQLGDIRASLLAFHGGQTASHQAALAVCAVFCLPGILACLPYMILHQRCTTTMQTWLNLSFIDVLAYPC